MGEVKSAFIFFFWQYSWWETSNTKMTVGELEGFQARINEIHFLKVCFI